MSVVPTPAAPGSISILLVEDHAMVRDALVAAIAREPDLRVVACAPGGADAVRLARAHRPDVALVDLSMPDMSGLAVAAGIRGECPATAVVALTRHADAAYVQAILRAGGTGYVLKQSPMREVVRAIRSAAAGQVYLDPALPRTGSEPAVDQAESAREASQLTAREVQVLQRLAWGMSHKDIAADLGVSVKTVEGHKASALRRLGLTSRADILRLALLQGWLKEI